MSRRLNELEQRFTELADAIPDSAEKEAISVLHAMLQEVMRDDAARVLSDGSDGGGMRDLGMTLDDIIAMHHHAPPMEGTAQNEPLPVGSSAPDFTLSDPNAEPVSLVDYRGQPVVVVFYPLDWSPTCSDQLSLYQSDIDELERYGAALMAISVDSIYSHGAWAAVRGLTFPLLADFEPKGEVARRYSVYRSGDGYSERALYVIDGDGVIRYARVSDRLNHIPDIYELYQVLAEITGRVAPGATAGMHNGHQS